MRAVRAYGEEDTASEGEKFEESDDDVSTIAVSYVFQLNSFCSVSIERLLFLCSGHGGIQSIRLRDYGYRL